jgi:O-antigen/teichoic acid export membrane protein
MANPTSETLLSRSAPPVTRPWPDLRPAFLRRTGRPTGLARRFLHGTLSLVVVTLGCQLVAVAFSPLLTRLYAPADFGVLGVFMAIYSPLLAVSALRYECAIPLPRDDRDALSVLVLSAVLAFAFAGVLGLVLIFVAAPLATAFRFPTLEKYLWVLPFAVLFGAWYSALSYWNLRRKQYGQVATSRAAETLGRVCTECSLGFGGWQPAGLLAAQGLAKTYATLVLARRLPWHALRLRRGHFAQMAAAARMHRRFPTMAVPSTVANTVSGNLPCLLMPLLFGPVQAGFFLVGQRLASWPVTLFGQAIAQVFYSELSSHDISQLAKRRMFYRVSLLLTLASLGVGAVFLAAPLWCGLLLGDRWQSAGATVAALTPMLVGQLIVSPLSMAYYANGKQHILLMLDGARVVLTASVFAVSWLAGLSAAHCILAFSLSLAAIYVAHWWMLASFFDERRNPQHSTEPPSSRPAL